MEGLTGREIQHGSAGPSEVEQSPSVSQPAPTRAKCTQATYRRAGWGSEMLFPVRAFLDADIHLGLAALQGCLQEDLPLLLGEPHIVF